MSELIKHECGIALVRLRKPLEFYLEKYGTAMYGLNKLYLMMQKQHNRGQDGAGIATINLDVPPGTRYISRKRSNKPQAIRDLFEQVYKRVATTGAGNMHNPDFLRQHVPYTGEVLMGHLRYGTHGDNSIERCHPFLRQNNWRTRSLVLAGNFNLTNVDELFKLLVQLGQHPKEMSDTVTVMEKIGHFLEQEVQFLFDYFKYQGYSNYEISPKIEERLDLQRILRRASIDFDGGYVMAGMIGHGDAFVMRDPNGIRPAFHYQDDEVVVVASERPAIQTAFNVPYEAVQEIRPAHALIIKKDGRVMEKPFAEERERRSCSFERIYFSRGGDKEIYTERKNLGKFLVNRILKAIDYDFENTVFSFVPNTAETSFYGMMQGLESYLSEYKTKKLSKWLKKGKQKDKKIKRLMAMHPRVEKIAIKDAKLRTFITEDSSRSELVSHVYDVTYGIVRNHKDTLVLIDDSIVRGTTLRQSILRIVSRLKPKKIIVVSSAPQIRYPDCYGIDMSKMGDFVAFRALIELIKEQGKEDLLQEVYEQCKQQDSVPRYELPNYVKRLYDQFSDRQLEKKISEIITPNDIKPEVEILFQSIDKLHQACPDHNGDWYFSGNYPTPGGNRVVNKAFINFMEGNNERAY